MPPVKVWWGKQGDNLANGGALSMTVADRTDGRCNFIKFCPGAVGGYGAEVEYMQEQT